MLIVHTWSGLIPLSLSLSLSLYFLLFCLAYSISPIPIYLQIWELEHNSAVLIKRVVCTKAKSPDNTMFSICLKWMLFSMVVQLRLKLKTIVMEGINTDE